MEGSVSKLGSAEETSNMSRKLFLDPSTTSWLTKSGQDEAEAHRHGGNCRLLLMQVLKCSSNALSFQWEDMIQEA